MYVKLTRNEFAKSNSQSFLFIFILSMLDISLLDLEKLSLTIYAALLYAHSLFLDASEDLRYYISRAHIAASHYVIKLLRTRNALPNDIACAAYRNNAHIPIYYAFDSLHGKEIK